jgi:hypothetical protein
VLFVGIGAKFLNELIIRLAVWALVGPWTVCVLTDFFSHKTMRGGDFVPVLSTNSPSMMTGKEPTAVISHHQQLLQTR